MQQWLKKKKKRSRVWGLFLGVRELGGGSHPHVRCVADATGWDHVRTVEAVSQRCIDCDRKRQMGLHLDGAGLARGSEQVGGGGSVCFCALGGAVMPDFFW